MLNLACALLNPDPYIGVCAGINAGARQYHFEQGWLRRVVEAFVSFLSFVLGETDWHKPLEQLLGF